MNIEGLGATVRIGRFGPYVEKNGGEAEPLRASLPKDATPADLDAERIEALLRQRAEGPAVVGVHPESGEQIFLLDGQYGPYVQLGQQEEGSKVKPKRASLPKGAKPEDVTLDMAVGLLALPRMLGNHPESGRPVKAGLGRFGPYILHDLGKGEADFRSLKAGDEVLTVNLDRAVALLAEPKALRGRRAAATPIREIGVASGRWQAGPALRRQVRPVHQAWRAQCLAAPRGRSFDLRPGRRGDAARGEGEGSQGQARWRAHPRARRQVVNVTVVGGGLAGCEAAWALADRGFDVTLWEMRPVVRTRGSPDRPPRRTRLQQHLQIG